MNKTAFYLILILMGGSMFGISALQLSYIKTSIEIQEDSFDQSVLMSLNKVANQLKEDEKAIYEMSRNGFSSNSIDKDLEQGEAMFNSDYKTEKDFFQMDYEDENSSEDGEECFCPVCLQRKGLIYLEQEAELNKRKSNPIADRIDLELLQNYLENALRNNGIKTLYDYGVYSNSKKKFVIENGRFLVIDDAPNSSLEVGTDNLFHSKYKVDLYPDNNLREAAGELMVYFPTKGQFLFSTIWKQLISVLVFTLIVLFCFAYTIQIILRQKKISEMKNDFINNMTHEFKTPIATISLASDSITNPKILENPAKVNRFADIIKQENRRMNNQVEKVLQIALVEKKNFELKISKIDVHNIIEMAITSVGFIIENRGGKTISSLKAKNHMIEGDQTHIANLINNLMDNANKYSPDDPVIQVSTYDRAGGIVIEISDNGIGMSKDVLKNIFEKFYRVHTGNRHDVKGFGLGLSYVKAIVDAHDGKVSVSSELGKGSKFSVFLPSRHK